MRWYCVNPSLPLRAELRIRAAPDSSAAERARISQGRAIAACSPIFHVAGDGIDTDPISWVQVAYQDATSGETEGGFIMAALPGGTALVTPWESTNFFGCCNVTDSTALLFDGPNETAQSLGPVQSINFLYCIMETREKRVRIFYPELESVWIDKKDLQVVCTRLEHEKCSTPHTFYELNEALPEEAQIAIREFPSKEAQTVGLVSRGDTLEVTVRGGNWLRIAGGSIDKAWIMWRTDALELLQEASDVRSSTCEKKEENRDGPTGNESLTPANSDEDGNSAEAITTTPPPSSTTPAGSVGLVLDDSLDDAVLEQNVRSWDDLSIQCITTSADEVQEHGGDGSTSLAATLSLDVCARDKDTLQVVQSWGDELTNPAHDLPEEEGADKGVSADIGDLDASTDVIGSEAEFAGPGGLDDVFDPVDELVVDPYGEDMQDTVDIYELEGNEQSGGVTDNNVASFTSAAQVPIVNGTDDSGNELTHPARDLPEEEGADKGVSADIGDLDASTDVIGSEAEFAGPGGLDDVFDPVDELVVDPYGEDMQDTVDIYELEGNEQSGGVTDNNVASFTSAAQVPIVNGTDDSGNELTHPARDLPEEEGADKGVSADIGDLDASTDVIGNEAEFAGPGGLDDVFDPVDELVVDPYGEDMQDTVDIYELEENEQSGGVTDNNVASFTSAAQVPIVNRTDDSGDELTHPARDLPEDEGADKGVSADIGDLDASTDVIGSEAEFAGPGGLDDVFDPVDELVVDPYGEDMQDTVDIYELEENEQSGGVTDNNVASFTSAAQVPIVNGTDDSGNELTHPARDLPEEEGADKGVSADIGDLDASTDVIGNEAEFAGPGGLDDVFDPVDELVVDPYGEDMQDTVDIYELEENEQSGGVTDNNVASFTSAAQVPIVNRTDDSGDELTHPARDLPEDEGADKGVSADIGDLDASTDVIGNEAEFAGPGGLDDVFDPVDELVVDPYGEDMQDTVDIYELEGNEQSGGVTDNNVASFTSAAQVPIVNGTDDSVLLLQAYGIIKYCELKQSLNPASDKLSQAMFNADQDDADLVFEVLVGDDPLSDEWFHDVASKSLAASLHSDSHATASNFSRAADPKDTYALIMGDATPEAILDSELLDDDDGNYDLVSYFKYPLPKRRLDLSGSRPSPLRSQSSTPPRRLSSVPVNAASFPVISVKSPTPPAGPASSLSAILPTKSASSRLVQRKSVGVPSDVAKPLGTLARPRSFVNTPATPSTISFRPASSRLAQPAPACATISSSKPRGSLLQRKSFLPRPQMSNILTRTSSNSKPAESSGLPMPRKSFGFRHSSSSPKK